MSDKAREIADLLNGFASHHISCAIYQRSWVAGEPSCTCGLDAAREQLATLQTKP